MKTTRYTAIFLISMLLAAGCAKEMGDVQLNDRNSEAIELSTVSTSPLTKAAIEGGSLTTDEAAAGIGLFLLDSDGDNYGGNGTNVRYDYASGKWTAQSPLRVANNAQDITLSVLNTGIAIDNTSVGLWDNENAKEITVGGQYKVKVVLADDITDHDVLTEIYIDEENVKIVAFSQAKNALKCTITGTADVSQSKQDNIYTFTISNISSNVTATIGYLKAITVSVLPNNPDWGSASFTGECYEGKEIILTAEAKTGYQFIGWYNADGNKLDWTNPQQLTLSSDLSVTAVFKPADALLGVFSVSDSKKVRFSKGNLYCSGANFDDNREVRSIAEDGWGFEERQYDTNPDGNNDTRNESHISHFMWCYTAETAMALRYNEDWNELNHSFFAAKGFNVNGYSGWFTLTNTEWEYLLSNRTMKNGVARYTNKTGSEKFTIEGNGYTGLFIYPDDYNGKEVGDETETWTWDNINSAGIVFLPAAGYRDLGHANNPAEVYMVALKASTGPLLRAPSSQPATCISTI